MSSRDDLVAQIALCIHEPASTHEIDLANVVIELVSNSDTTRALALTSELRAIMHKYGRVSSTRASQLQLNGRRR
jgi:hypothetical protein